MVCSPEQEPSYSQQKPTTQHEPIQYDVKGAICQHHTQC